MPIEKHISVDGPFVGGHSNTGYMIGVFIAYGYTPFYLTLLLVLAWLIGYIFNDPIREWSQAHPNLTLVSIALFYFLTYLATKAQILPVYLWY